MGDFTDDKLSFGQLIHELGWERGELAHSILRLGAAAAALVLVIVILCS